MANATTWTGRAIRLARPAAYVWLAVLALENLVAIPVALNTARSYAYGLGGDVMNRIVLAAVGGVLVRLVLLIVAATLVWIGRSRFVLAAAIMLIVCPIGNVLQLLADGLAFYASNPRFYLQFLNLSALMTYVVAALLVFAALRARSYAEASLQSLASGFD